MLQKYAWMFVEQDADKLVLTCTGFMTTNIRIWIIPFNSQTSNALHPRFHRYGVLKKSTRFLQSSILPIQLEGGITRFFCFLQNRVKDKRRFGTQFSNINWKENCISLSQQKTGNALSLPLSKDARYGDYFLFARWPAHSPPRLLSFWAITHRFSHWVSITISIRNFISIYAEQGLLSQQRGTQAYTLSAIRLPQICWEKALRCRMCPKSSVTVTSV